MYVLLISSRKGKYQEHGRGYQSWGHTSAVTIKYGKIWGSDNILNLIYPTLLDILKSYQYFKIEGQVIRILKTHIYKGNSVNRLQTAVKLTSP